MLCLGMCLAARFGSAAIAQFGGRQTEDLTLPGLVPGLGSFLLPSTRWSLHSCLGLRKDGRDDLELFSSQANQWLSSSLKKCPTHPAPHFSMYICAPRCPEGEQAAVCRGAKDAWCGVLVCAWLRGSPEPRQLSWRARPRVWAVFFCCHTRPQK